MGVTRQSISRWEQNVAYPEVEKILRLSDILNVSCDYLLKENETRKSITSDEKEKQSVVTRLLRSMVGKKVKIDLLDGDMDVDFFDTACEILELDGDFMKVSCEKNKAVEVHLIDTAKIASLELVEE